MWPREGSSGRNYFGTMAERRIECGGQDDDALTARTRAGQAAIRTGPARRSGSWLSGSWLAGQKNIRSRPRCTTSSPRCTSLRLDAPDSSIYIQYSTLFALTFRAGRYENLWFTAFTYDVSSACARFHCDRRWPGTGITDVI